MKVKDLIKALAELDQDVEVRLECDHGQVAMTCNWVGYIYIREDEYMADEVHKDDLEGDEIKVVVLEAY